MTQAKKLKKKKERAKARVKKIAEDKIITNKRVFQQDVQKLVKDAMEVEQDFNFVNKLNETNKEIFNNLRADQQYSLWGFLKLVRFPDADETFANFLVAVGYVNES